MAGWWHDLPPRHPGHPARRRCRTGGTRRGDAARRRRAAALGHRQRQRAAVAAGAADDAGVGRRGADACRTGRRAAAVRVQRRPHGDDVRRGDVRGRHAAGERLGLSRAVRADRGVLPGQRLADPQRRRRALPRLPAHPRQARAAAVHRAAAGGVVRPAARLLPWPQGRRHHLLLRQPVLRLGHHGDRGAGRRAHPLVAAMGDTASSSPAWRRS